MQDLIISAIGVAAQPSRSSITASELMKRQLLNY